MAKMIDKKPDFHGEAKVWESIKTLLPDNIVAYNTREINGREFDFCLFIENLGILIIEVKGWIADKISVNGVDNIVVDGFSKPQGSPKKQARSYRFSLHNKISKKYNTSPLIQDMVCYPFISKNEYYEKRLDIVSEEEFTIFKEDLESKEAFLDKIMSAYKKDEKITHSPFSYDFMCRLRSDWEPDFKKIEVTDSVLNPYSILSVYPQKINDSDIDNIVTEYFNGIKRIVFFGDRDNYIETLNKLNNRCKEYNINISENNISIGYKEISHNGKESFRTFNLELYLINNLYNRISNILNIEEGKLDSEKKEILDYLEANTTFNKQQYMVEHAASDKNTLIQAGAGTGKTFSMVSRVAFLCNKRVDCVTNLSEEIAMVTFTNDAAINMKKRLKKMFINYFILTGEQRFLRFVEDTDRAQISTIHKFALEILQSESMYTGLGTDFKIASNEYDRSKLYDTLLGKYIENQESNNPNFSNELPVPVYDLKKKIMGIADRLLSKSVDLEKIDISMMGNTTKDVIPYLNEIIDEVVIPAEIKYSTMLHENNSIDLKECIILLDKVVSNLKDTLKTINYKYMFIDEFQDTDDVQINIFQKIQKLIDTKCRFFVVGDLKQSIYRFRGAQLSAFRRMKEKSEFEWEEYTLTRNYRTDSRLLKQYEPIFETLGEKGFIPYDKNKDCLVSDIITSAEENNIFVEVPCHCKDEDNFNDCLSGILKHQENVINRMMQNDERLSLKERTIAILVRNNWQIEKIVNAVANSDIKIETKSGGDLYRLDSSTDLYKLLLALSNPSNPIYLTNFIESNYIQLNLNYQNYKDLSHEECAKDLNRILDEFFKTRMNNTWLELVKSAHENPILYVLKQIFDGLQPWKQYSKNFTEQKNYIANYEYLLERIVKFNRVDSLTLNKVIEHLRINILTGKDQLSRNIESDDNDVHFICTTIHKSKGLEYGTVILPFANDDIGDLRKIKLDAHFTNDKLSYSVVFDNKLQENNSNYNFTKEKDEQISEEARILYVALTRAIRNCIWINNIDSNSTICWNSFMEV